MTPKSVYLAGPITGLTHDDAKYGWRATARDLLKHHAPHIECYSPMRQKEFLSDAQSMACKGADLDRLKQAISRPLGILTRDSYDVRERDCVLACFLGAQIVSIGTVWEIGYASALRKPVVIVMEPGNIHDHVFVTHSTGYVTPSIEEGCLIVRSLLTPGL